MDDEQELDRIDALRDSTNRIADRLDEEGRKRDERITAANKASGRSRTLGIIGMCVGAFGLIVAIVAVVIAALATHDLHIASHATTAARIASCQQYNVQQQNAITHELRGNEILANNIAPPPRSDKTQRAVEVFLAQQRAESLAGHPYRDCTPDGVADYLRHQSPSVPTTLPPRQP